MIKQNLPYFYKDKAIFGMDIGHTSIKVMQSSFGDPNAKNKKPSIIGYGANTFANSAIDDGVIVKPEIIASAAKEMFDKKLIGDITTNRAVIAIPAYRVFTRYLVLPKLKPNEIEDATKLEVEQYIPTPIDELYLDYEIANENSANTEVFFVGIPKKIVDSYLELAAILNIETILIEPTLNSSGRLFSFDKNNNIASVIMDFGSQSSDMSIYVDRILATGTVNSGGNTFTHKIKEALMVSDKEAQIIKNKYGLGVSKHQKEIISALKPTLDQIIEELKRIIRYYEEEYAFNNKPIKQIVVLGGGANMPGLNDYLTSSLRLAVRHSDPWQYFDFNKLKIPSIDDKLMYATVAGLSIINPKEIF